MADEHNQALYQVYLLTQQRAAYEKHKAVSPQLASDYVQRNQHPTFVPLARS